MTGIATDVRMAWRRLRMSPGLTIFSVVTLAVGVGATTAIYSVIDAALLRPPFIKDIQQVVNLYHADPFVGPMHHHTFSWPDFQDLREEQTSFSEIAAWTRFRETLVAGGSGEVILGEMVSAEYFHLVGVSAALGRTIDATDDRPGATPVIVLSDAIWRRKFEADPAVLGRTIMLRGHAFVIIGVAPAAFRGVDVPNVMATAAWVPLSVAERLSGASLYKDHTRREGRWLFLKARLEPGQTAAAAAAELSTIGRQLDAAYPLDPDWPAGRRAPSPEVSRSWRLVPAADVLMHESVHRIAGPMASTVVVVVVLVLLVVCTNIANLLLARGAVRRHELAVRLSLGASRGRLVREELWESAIVCLAGAVVSILIARALMISIFSTPIHVTAGLMVQVNPELSASVGIASFAATVTAFLVFGLAPAVHATRGDLRDALAADSGSTAIPRWRGRRLLVTGQVGVSVALAAVAGLCVQQLMVAARHQSGIELERLALVRVDFKLQHQDEDRARETIRLALDRMRLMPAVDAVAASSGLPFGITTPGASVTSPERPLAPDGAGGHHVQLMACSTDVFRALGIPLRAGRGFDKRDSAEALPVAIVNAGAAVAVFGHPNVIGREIVVRRTQWAGEPPPAPVIRTIVGVVADTDAGSIGRRGGVVYVPFEQHYEAGLTMVARTPGDPRALVALLRDVLARVDPELAILDAGTGPALTGAVSVPLQVAAGLSGVLGVIALVLAMTGLYGVLSYLVARRTAEIGIRRALGATTKRIMRLVVFDGLRPIVDGLVVGLALGAIARQALWPLFRRLTPSIDPLVLAGVIALFVTAGLLASYLPARRAARVDPTVALRQL